MSVVQIGSKDWKSVVQIGSTDWKSVVLWRCNGGLERRLDEWLEFVGQGRRDSTFSNAF
jgi:hypothetical protein